MVAVMAAKKIMAPSKPCMCMVSLKKPPMNSTNDTAATTNMMRLQNSWVLTVCSSSWSAGTDFLLFSEIHTKRITRVMNTTPERTRNGISGKANL